MATNIYIMLTVGLGSFIGGCLRYLTIYVTKFIYSYNQVFAAYLAIIIINVLGSLITTFISFTVINGVLNNNFLKYFLIPGILGGFTTFSTFSLEFISLIEN